MPAYSFAYGALGENRTHRTTLLRRIRLPVASQGHLVEFKVTLSAHGFLTTKTSFALKRRWFRMSESNCYSYAQGMRVTVTPHSNYYWFSIIYYIINSIKSQDFGGLERCRPRPLPHEMVFSVLKITTPPHSERRLLWIVKCLICGRFLTAERPTGSTA